MNWGSPAEFFAMGGKALYVWGSYAVTALFMVVEIILVKKRNKQVWQRLKRMARMQQEKV